MKYDWIVIGGGSAGVRFSRRMASTGKQVVLIDEQDLGGTCVHRGCIPKKLYIFSAYAKNFIEHSKDFGIHTTDSTLDFKMYADRVFQHIEKIRMSYTTRLINAGVEIKEGHAQIVDPHTVSVDGVPIQGEKILIATGAVPIIPKSIEGGHLAYTSDDLFSLRILPKSMVIVGGGFIGLEFYQIFKDWDVDVSLNLRGEYVLNTRFDLDIRKRLTTHLEKEKAFIRNQIQKIEKIQDQFLLTFKDGKTVKTHYPLLATGRVGNFQHLNLEEIGIQLTENKQFIHVNPTSYVTNIPSIYAAGDVIGTIQLTPVAIEQAECIVDKEGRDLKHVAKINYFHIPTAVFVDPPAAFVGYTEEQAAHHFGNIDIYSSEFTPLDYVMKETAVKTFIKVIVEVCHNKVVGIHMYGYVAAEIIQGFALAMSNGLSILDLNRFIGIHPSSAEEFFSLVKTKEIKKFGNIHNT